MRVPKGYYPLKLISPVQQQMEMAKMLVKRKVVKGRGWQNLVEGGLK